VSDTVFVTMYHPALGNAQVDAPLIAVPTYQSHGWLLLDPSATPPPVATPFLTQAAGDSRYVRDWAGAETVTAGAVRMAPDGHVLVRTANGTTRSSYDATEVAAWTQVGGSGAVASVVGQTGAVTGAQIAADPALRAAFVPFWKPSTAYTAGQIVLNPSGQTVSANATFTSGASYSASNWTLVSGGGAPTVVDNGSYVTMTVA
jgi:hypothetical protein